MLNETDKLKLREFVSYKFSSFLENNELKEALERTHIDLEETYRDFPTYYAFSLWDLYEIYLEKSNNYDCDEFITLENEVAKLLVQISGTVFQKKSNNSKTILKNFINQLEEQKIIKKDRIEIFEKKILKSIEDSNTA